MNSNRRRFLKNVGMAVLTVSVIPTTLVSAMADDNSTSPEDTLKIKSGPSAFAPLPGHFHFVMIPMEAFRVPPSAGVSLKTTTAYGHHHRVKLTQEQLTAISAGQSVIVQDTVKDHHYEIKLAS